MTEEENKAIEDLKEEIKSLEKAKIEFSNEIEDKSWLRKNINELDKDIFYKNTLLNLIEKLQKEIEEKTIIIMAGAEKVKQLEKEFIIKQEVKENYIPKNKIREKLEKIEKEKEQYYATGQHLMYMLLKNQLKSLLEEE